MVRAHRGGWAGEGWRWVVSNGVQGVLTVGWKGKGSRKIPLQRREQGPRWGSALDEEEVISLKPVVLN